MAQSSSNSLDACIPERNATVSASAGSGKTWLLVTRIIRLLLAGAEPGNIIALTFTRKAAGEMQIRLNQRLYDMATADDTALSEMLEQTGCDATDKNRQYARKLYENLVLDLYPVRLQTFHSFCQDILSRFPLEADIPPGFTLTEDTSLLMRQAWQMLFDQANRNALRSRPESQALSKALDTIMDACNGPENTRAALNSFLDQRCEWWAFTADSHQPVQAACERLNQQLELDTQYQLDDDIDVALRQFLNDLQCKRLEQIQTLLIDTRGKQNIQAAGDIKSSLTQYQKSTEFSVQQLEGIYNQLRTVFITNDGKARTKGRELNKALIKNLGEANANRFVELHEQIANDLLDCDEQIKRLNSRKINFAWYLAGHRYIELFQQLKSDMRLLDFNDLEWKTYCLLQHSDNAHWVQYKIDQRIDHILIDEFQDTNPTQWQLLLPLLEEIAASQHDRLRSVFLVGDEKQSIYSFRRANPELQAEASSWLHRHMQATAVPLDFSRRSSPAIIHCVNRVFEQEHIHELMHGFSHHDTHLATVPGHVQVVDLFSLDEDGNDENDNSDDKEPDDQAVYFRNPLIEPRIVDTTTARHQEAEYVANQIMHMIEQCWMITGADNQSRPVEFSDIMILTRYRTHIEIYEQALKSHAIPFIGSKKGGLLDSLEIQDLRCLLEVLVAPYNNLTLAQLLKSPVFDASDHDLELLAGMTGNHHWFERLTLAARSEEMLLSAKLKRAADMLQQWQQYAEHLPVHDCLDRIFHEGDIMARYRSACENGNANSVIANCQRFLELSLETDSGRYPGIARFLQRLQHIENYSDSPPEEPLPEGESNRVRVMTVHASKGLEAPVVFLVDTNSADSNRNAYKSLVDWPAKTQRPVSFQLQLSSRKTDAITAALQDKKERDKKREELNLLYVAITRARQALFVSGSKSKHHTSDSGYRIVSDALSDCKQITGVDGCSSRILTFGSLKPKQPQPVHPAATPPGHHDHNNQEGNATDEVFAAGIHDSRLSSPPETGLLQLNRHWRIIAPSQNESAGLPGDSDTLDMDAQLAKWRGTTIHKLLELLSASGHYPATADTIQAGLQTLIAESRRDYPRYAVHVDNCLDEALSNYNDPDLAVIFQPTDDARHLLEMPVLYTDDQGSVVKGYMDHVIRRTGEVTIIDYKSHQLPEQLDLDERVKPFKAQLAYYRHGAQNLWPNDRIKTGILFTHTRQLVWLSKP